MTIKICGKDSTTLMSNTKHQLARLWRAIIMIMINNNNNNNNSNNNNNDDDDDDLAVDIPRGGSSCPIERLLAHIQLTTSDKVTAVFRGISKRFPFSPVYSHQHVTLSLPQTVKPRHSVLKRGRGVKREPASSHNKLSV